MKLSFRIAVLLAVVVLLRSDPSAAVSDFRGLGYLAGGTTFESRASAISQDGSTVVGWSFGAGIQAFRWTSGTGMQGLGEPPGVSYFRSEARAVSADGSTVVGIGHISGIGTQAFVWRSGASMVGLGYLPGASNPDASAGAVSPDGSVVVGYSRSAAGVEAARWTNLDAPVGLGDLPGGTFGSRATGVSADGSVVIGTGTSGNSTTGGYLDATAEAFRWTSGGMLGLGDLPLGSFRSVANAISADGSTIVGSGISGGSASEAFRWTSAEGMVGLGSLREPRREGYETSAKAVSADGSIIVGKSDSPTGQAAFIWDARHGMRSIQSILLARGIDLTGWTLSEAAGVSGDGRKVVGYGINPNGDVEAWLATIGVPEPSTGLLIGAALLWLVCRRPGAHRASRSHRG